METLEQFMSGPDEDSSQSRRYFCLQERLRKLLGQRKLQFWMNRSSGGGLPGEAPSCPDKIQNLSSSYYQHVSILLEIILELPPIPVAAASLIPPAFYLPSHFGHMATSLSIPFFSPFPSTFMNLLFPRHCSVCLIGHLSSQKWLR